MLQAYDGGLRRGGIYSNCVIGRGLGAAKRSLGAPG